MARRFPTLNEGTNSPLNRFLATGKLDYIDVGVLDCSAVLNCRYQSANISRNIFRGLEGVNTFRSLFRPWLKDDEHISTPHFNSVKKVCITAKLMRYTKYQRINFENVYTQLQNILALLLMLIRGVPMLQLCIPDPGIRKQQKTSLNSRHTSCTSPNL
jgi:hypothetical protein